MDDIVLRGMTKWPNVPAVYGWLSLNRRGDWLLKGERVANSGIAAFFGRNYTCDKRGRWFLQNGPQRVFVTLEYTPYVYRVTSITGAPFQVVAHSGAVATAISAAYIDEDGFFMLDTDIGIGLLRDTDLELLVPRFRLPDGTTPDEATLASALEALQAGERVVLWLDASTTRIPVRPVRAAAVPQRFGFVADPVQPTGQEECY